MSTRLPGESPKDPTRSLWTWRFLSGLC
ncbi:protein of unknown function [Streptomyces sp. KY75]|nr:protein of unknown function [Streptomyces sp. KY70]CAD5993152.1 protein of unknown function [Streptomyces sp. KY75]